MTKMQKRKLISLITTLAMGLSFGSANIIEAYEASSTDPTSVMLDCERVDELSDGGKIYVYLIDGAEHKFPIPPDEFDPLTAEDKKLELYGFPPRPNKENKEDYDYWVNIMNSYKSTVTPEIKQIIENNKTEDNGIVALNSNSISQRAAGYSASLFSTNNFFSQVQGDFVQPTIISTYGTCRNTFMVGFGDLYYRYTYTQPAISAGTMCEGKGTAHAYYECLGGGNVADQTKVLTNLKVNPGDKVHVYVSYQKANNAFNYYIVNMSTGQQISDVVTFNHSYFFSGTYANWFVGRQKSSGSSLYNLGNFGSIEFTNCKAMVNTSTTWTNLGDLSWIRYDMCEDGNDPSAATPGDIVNNNQFSCKWLSYE